MIRLALVCVGGAVFFHSFCVAAPNPCEVGPKAIQEWKGVDARHPTFHTPTLLAVDPSGNVYLLDQREYQVLQFSGDGTYQRNWELPTDTWRDGREGTHFFTAMAASDSFLYVSSPGLTFQCYKDGSIAQWNFGSCRNGLAADRQGNVFVSTSNARGWDHGQMGLATRRDRVPPAVKQRLDVLPESQRGGIWKLTSQGHVLEHWDSPPWPIAITADGVLYAIEPENGGAFLRLAGDKIEIKTCKLRLDSTGLLRSLAVGPNGRCFVNDYKNVVEFDGTGKVVRRWCDPGPEYDLIDSPGSLSVDAAGHLYVVDQFKSRVLKFDLGTP